MATETREEFNRRIDAMMEQEREWAREHQRRFDRAANEMLAAFFFVTAVYAIVLWQFGF